jgi:NADP-dependent 3-hydroxy acid dehydrogenase YdfG
MDLSGKAALITGGTSGIGLAVAERLAERGVGLVLHGRRREILEEHGRRLPNCAVMAGDIAEADAPGRVIDLTLERHGRLDIVFNNAGLIHAGSIEDIDIDKMCAMVRVNVEAAFRMAYTALKHFRTAGSGHLVNTSSVLGVKVRATAGAYAGTKHAVEALTQALRMEVAGSAIRVTSIEPGLVETDLHREMAVRPSVAYKIPEPLAPDDIARAVLFALEQPAHVAVPVIMVLPQSQAF